MSCKRPPLLKQDCPTTCRWLLYIRRSCDLGCITHDSFQTFRVLRKKFPAEKRVKTLGMFYTPKKTIPECFTSLKKMIPNVLHPEKCFWEFITSVSTGPEIPMWGPSVKKRSPHRDFMCCVALREWRRKVCKIA